MRSLLLTVLVVFSSLGGMALAQKLAETNLYKTVSKGGETFAKYYNQKYECISWLVLINLYFSVTVVGIMARMNWIIFNRDVQYAAIAENNLKFVCEKYDMELEKEEKEKRIKQEVAYEKIHNLEILVERILKNHESIGDAFAESQRREKLLSAVISNGLGKVNDKDEDKDDEKIYKKAKMEWNYLEEKKRDCRWRQCHEKAKQEIVWLEERTGKGNKDAENAKEQRSERRKPCDCSFITVYDDMLLYRDNTLVWEEWHGKKRKWKVKKQSQNYISLYERRALRYTIKKRLLFFYLRGEKFTGMDLSGISFSGADLRYANFSDCNLAGIRLKGANCEGTDFTRSKVMGMYFWDNISEEAGDEEGEIQLTCKDTPCKSDTCKKWDPYHGEEATYLENATFKEADVSRAYLSAPGELEDEQDFPFGGSESDGWKLKKDHIVFSMRGTSFDDAKIYNSFFKNIDFTNASLSRAQMYDAGMVQTKARSVNLSETVLTYTCMAWCDFANANFSDASMSETVLVRINFSGAKMANVNFSSSNIVDCNFDGVSCQNASFKNIISDLDKIQNNLPKALKETTFNEPMGISFCYATLTNTDFSGADLLNVDFGNAIGQDCIFTKTRGVHVSFRNAIFRSSILNSARFHESCFICTMMGNSLFANSQFVNCLFYETDFSEALFNQMEESCFMGGSMYRVDFSNARGIKSKCFRHIYLKEVDFRGTGISKRDFEGQEVTLVECIFSDGGEDGKH